MSTELVINGRVVQLHKCAVVLHIPGVYKDATLFACDDAYVMQLNEYHPHPIDKLERSYKILHTLAEARDAVNKAAQDILGELEKFANSPNPYLRTESEIAKRGINTLLTLINVNE